MNDHDDDGCYVLLAWVILFFCLFMVIVEVMG